MSESIGEGVVVPDEYLGLQGIADHLGKSRETVKKWELPEPDVTIGGGGAQLMRGWAPETIDEWWARNGGGPVLRPRRLPPVRKVACPECGGTGKIVKPLSKGSRSRVEQSCSACDGKGVRATRAKIAEGRA